MALRRGLHFLRGSGVRSTQPLTKMDQVGSRYRLAALRDDCGGGWPLPGVREEPPAMSTGQVGRPYQFSRPYELSVSSSSHSILRSGRPISGALHGSINNRGAAQDAGNIAQELGNFAQAKIAGSNCHV